MKYISIPLLFFLLFHFILYAFKDISNIGNRSIFILLCVVVWLASIGMVWCMSLDSAMDDWKD